ncbi:E3 ubiquitin-protein ligase RBX1 isoform X3 [Ictidomys tridecemlineatus]
MGSPGDCGGWRMGQCSESQEAEIPRTGGAHPWNAVALWAWDIVVDNCAICRNHIMDLSCFSLPLHLSLAQNTAGVPIGQQRVGIPKVWTLEKEFFHQA